MAVYGLDLLLCGLAYYLLWFALRRIQPADAPLQRAIGRATKERVSLLVYVVATPVALVAPVVAISCYVGIALRWFVPDPRIERTLER